MVMTRGIKIMYCDYFKLKEKPFNLTPDPRYLYLGKNHSEPFAQLLYATQEGAGFAVFIGEVGTGKSTVCRAILDRLPENFVPAFIFNPNMDELELYQAINRELGLECETQSKNALQYILNQYLIEQKSSGKHVVLLIDEAQNLSQPVLEQIRLISNLETEKEKLIQIILVGQPELRSLLERQSLRQLRQRISVSCNLGPLDFYETVEYIRHRLSTAGSAPQDIFNSSALRRLFRYSGGIPRLINIVCDRGLLAAYSSGKRIVTRQMIVDCIREIEGKASPQSGYGTVASALTAAASILALIFFLAYPGVETEAGTHPVPLVVAQNSEPGVYAGQSSEKVKELFSKNARLLAASSILDRWNDGRPISDKEKSRSLAALVKGRRFKSFEAVLDYERLRAINYPAILELKDKDGRIGYLPVVSIWGKKLFSDASGERFINKEWVLQRWTGRTYILWKDFKSLPKNFARGHKGFKTRWLQASLAKLGYGEIKPLTGFFGRKTQRLVIRFQIENRLEANGRVGPLTKMFIYKRLPEFATPGLT